MPQLDRIIIFPQIFWLFLIFTSFYIVSTHFFLPEFLKSLKSRKSVIDLNELKANTIKQQIIESEQKFKDLLTQDLARIKFFFDSNSAFKILNLENSEAKEADRVISQAVKNSILFCNFQILNAIEIHCKSINNPKNY
uniref:ATP synthase F0 subunit 8 n=1 Tax=Pterocladiella musciformis TaxID=2699131 RepID=A0A1D8X7U1_9FLOR|nr:ATP synthase F0 subunit 8 [Pterocladiella musciformis]AOX49094.1 ATP synthase F0 subunit 8 [Pterocladiella musciformis]